MGKVITKKKAAKKKPAVTVKLGMAYKKLIKKNQWITVESVDCGHPSFGKVPAQPPKRGRWTTDDHCIDIREEDPDKDCLVVAKSWDHCDVILDVELDEWVTLTNDCIVGQGFKIWVLEQRVVSGLIRKIKSKKKK